MTPEEITTIKDDADYLFKAGFIKLVPCEDIKDDPPENLNISQVAVKPAPGRWGRCLLETSFPVNIGSEVIQNSFNEA
jgi:hypothetical protein